MAMSCPLCDRDLPASPASPEHDNAKLFTCEVCGQFWVPAGDFLSKPFDDELKQRRYLLSALTRSAPEPLTIDKKRRDDLRAGIPRDKTVLEKIELAIKWIAASSNELGDDVKVVLDRDYPAAWCKSPQEWKNLLYHLGEDLGLLRFDSLMNPEAAISVTMTGWKWLQEQPKASGSKVFIAMAFDPSLNPVKAAIETAIRDAGYDPIRVDDDHFNGGVMDRVIASIRESTFIVADFTKNRGGVYYEAAYAAGRDIPVVHVCAAECLDIRSEDRLHFDVQHLSFIPWTSDALTAFTDRLRYHILALFGRGPSAPSP